MATMAAGESECISQKTITDSSTTFFQLSLNTQESSTRVGVLGWKMKPTKNENTSEYFCDICKVSLNSQIQAASHYQGKSHLNKVKTAEKIAEIETLLESSATSNPATCEEAKPGIVTGFEATPSEAPSETHQSEYMYTQTATVDKQMMAYVPDYSASTVAIQPPPTASPNVPTISTPPVKRKRKTSRPMMCYVCQKSFNSESQAEQHFTSKAHISKVNSSDEPSTCPVSGTGAVATYETKAAEVKLGKNISTELCHCNACNITLNSKNQLQQHKRGLRHKIMTGKATAPPPAFEGWEGVRYKKLSAVIPTSNGFVATTKRFSTTGTRLGQFYCTECDISVNSQNQLDQHLLSQKHKLVASGQNTTSSHLATTQPRQTSSEMYNVNSQSQLDQQMLSSNRNVVASGRNKIQQQQQHNKPSPSSTGIQWNQFRCETCNISVNSQSQLDQHLSSPKHAAAENGQPPSGSGGRGRGQVRGRGRGQAAYRGGRSRGRGRSSGGFIPLSVSFIKKELYKDGVAHRDTMSAGNQVHRGTQGVWRGQPRRGHRVVPY